MKDYRSAFAKNSNNIYSAMVDPIWTMEYLTAYIIVKQDKFLLI